MNVCDSLIISRTQHRGGGNIHTLRLHEFGYAAGRVEFPVVSAMKLIYFLCTTKIKNMRVLLCTENKTMHFAWYETIEHQLNNDMYKHFFKRVIDFTIALIALLVIWPILLVIYIWLTIANKGAGAFFFQERPGLHGKIFKVIKFKTMTDERDAEGNLLPDAERLTKVGRFVRSTSIDELPQLINVLKGDMALIGPRPLLVQYLPLYNKEQARRHEVRPGISGWAQCHGRNAISWTEKFKLDVWYVDHCTLLTDLKVIFITIKKVLVRADINTTTGQSATMDYFNGYN